MGKTKEDSCGFLEEKAEELNFVEGTDKYRLLMEYGQSLKSFPEEKRVDKNKVPGCTSGVYIDAHAEDGKIIFTGCSDSVVVRGYVSLLVEALSGLSPGEIVGDVDECIERFVGETNIKAHLTPSRANAFGNIIEFMKKKAESLT